VSLALQFVWIGVTFQSIRVTRLGQRLSVPILVSADPNLQLACVAFLIPMAAGAIAEKFVFSPWRRRRFLEYI
jgi:hypothetical protein